MRVSASHEQSDQGGRARRQRVLRREARAARCRSRRSRARGDGADRPVGVRQVDVPALHQPDERHDPDRARDRPHRDRRRTTSTTPRSTWCSCARASAWCSRSRTRSRSRSTRTSPTDPRSTASPSSKTDLDEIVVDQPQEGGPVRGGEGPSDRLRHQPVRRPAAAAVHRARDRGQPGGDPDGRAVLGARPDRDRQDRGTDGRAARELHDHHRHAFDAAGGARLAAHRVLPSRLPGRGRARPRRSSPRRRTSARRTTSPAASAEASDATRG